MRALLIAALVAGAVALTIINWNSVIVIEITLMDKDSLADVRPTPAEMRESEGK